MKKLLSLLLLSVLIISGCSSNDSESFKNDSESTSEKKQTNVDKLSTAVKTYRDKAEADNATLTITSEYEEGDTIFDMEITKHMNTGDINYLYTFEKPSGMIIKMDTNSDSEVTYYNITLDGEDISDTYDQSQIDYMAEGYSEMAAAFDTIDFDSEIDYIEGLDEDEISYEEDYFNYVDAVNGSVSINEEGNHFKFDENGVEFEMVVGTEE